MFHSLEQILLIASILLLLSVLASRASQLVGIPALLLFLAIGMLSGSQGIGSIAFDNIQTAREIGTVALMFILFGGGLETDWEAVKPIIKDGIMLSTVGVIISTLVMAVAAYYILHFSIQESLLLGAIVSSTDAPAVFNILKMHRVNMSGRIKTLTEFEAASNDPMAIILTLMIIQSFFIPEIKETEIIINFTLQVLLGVMLGYVMGKFALWFLNNVQLENIGVYHALTISIIFFTYSFTNIVGGNGFLAVYLTGLILGKEYFPQKTEALHFYEGITWLMQITMFLTLGLLVYPLQLLDSFWINLLMACVLMLIARPISVFLALLQAKFNFREKLAISSLGFKGAVPIILATFPMMRGIPKSGLIFNLVFVIVILSVLIQGITTKRMLNYLLNKDQYAHK